jgi:ADP-ribose pyrophosphatase
MPEKVIAETRWLQFVETEGGWTYVKRTSGPDVVIIAAVTNDGKIIFVEQTRPPIGKKAIEMPAGVVGDNISNESILATAYRELLEETGYRAAKMTLLNSCVVSPGLTNEVVNVVAAWGLEKVTDGGGLPEEGEDIIVHEIPLDSAHFWLLNRAKLNDVAIAASVYTGLYHVLVNSQQEKPRPITGFFASKDSTP